jgi:hypothetical protein
LSTTPALARQLPAGIEQGLFELRLPNFRTATLAVLVRQSSGAVLLPVLPVWELLGIEAPPAPDPLVLTAPAQVSEPALGVDLARGVLRRGDQVHAIPGAEGIGYEGDLYISARLLGVLLAAEVGVDWSELAVALVRAAPFPAQALLAAEERRVRAQRLLERAQGIEERPPLSFHPATGGGVIEWGLSTSGRPLEETTLRVGAGVALLGGGLTTSAQFGLGRQTKGRADFGSLAYRRVFPEAKAVRLLTAGDVVVGGVLGRSVRGLAISNARQLRDPRFEPIEIRPTLPAGWDFEVYRGNELVGFSTGGSQSVLVPLQYGTNPLRVRMIGPTGEEVISQPLLQIPLQQLRPGEVEYQLGTGRCRGGDCNLAGFGTVRFGLSPELTVGGGLDYLDQDSSTAWSPHLTVRGSTLRGLSAELRVAPASLLELDFQYAANRPLTLSGRAGLSAPNSGQPSLFDNASSRWHGETATTLHLWGLSPLRMFRFAGRIEGPAGGGTEYWQASLLTSTHSLFSQLRYEQGPRPGRALLAWRMTAITPIHWPPPVRSASLSGGIGIERGEFRYLEASTSFSHAPLGTMYLFTQWDARERQSRLNLGLSRSTGVVRTQSNLMHSPQATNLSLAVEGAIGFGGMAGVLPSTTAGTGTAGLFGRVFYDHNRNGIFDAEDEIAAGIGVLAGPSVAVTDERGLYRAWGIPPYEAAVVSADTLALPDPSWTTLHRRMAIRPTPNIFNQVDIPLVRTTELIGQLVAAPGVATGGGVTVHLTEDTTGAEQTALTFSDGYLYISRLRPGRYTLRVAPASLAALRADAEPMVLHFDTGEHDVVELPPILLRRRETYQPPS